MTQSRREPNAELSGVLGEAPDMVAPWRESHLRPSVCHGRSGGQASGIHYRVRQGSRNPFADRLVTGPRAQARKATTKGPRRLLASTNVKPRTLLVRALGGETAKGLGSRGPEASSDAELTTRVALPVTTQWRCDRTVASCSIEVLRKCTGRC